MTRNPYDVLGLPKGTPMPQVRAQYFRLAKLHHPDKLFNVSEDERKEHEEIFKEITSAYDILDKGGRTGMAPDQDWRNVWAKVETLFQRPEVWDCMKRVFTDTLVDEADSKIQDIKVHTLYLAISLEEMHLGKVKKVQLFLHNIAEPVVARVSCHDYPCAKIRTTVDGHDHAINVHMTLNDHETYHFDDLLGKWDLHTGTSITWFDYIHGKTVVLPSLTKDDPARTIHIPPWSKMDVPVVLKGAGVAGRGDMYISCSWSPPTPQCWNTLSPEDQKELMRCLNALSA